MHKLADYMVCAVLKTMEETDRGLLQVLIKPSLMLGKFWCNKEYSQDLE